MRLSRVIMAHPQRQEFIPSLLRELGKTKIVWDEKNDRWDTGRRSMLAAPAGATHHLIVQDDAILPRGFLGLARAAAQAADYHPVGLYMGKANQGPISWRRGRAIAEAVERGTPWLEMEGPWWAVAIIIPTQHIEACAAWGDAHPEVENFDRRISRWFGHQKIPCWYTIPSLVEHRPVRENPSLVPGRTDNRQAFMFCGMEPEPLDFSQPPVVLEAPRKLSNYQSVIAERRYGRMIAKMNVAVPGPHGVPVRIRAGHRVPGRLQQAYRKAVAEAEAPAAPVAVEEPIEEPEEERKIVASDAAKSKASELGVDIASVDGTGKDGRITVADVEAAA